jgi:RNA polymerase sigma factor (sigma-70 family)
MTQSEQDRELLTRWAAQADEAAFRQLVERYAGLVHGVAVRKAGGSQGLAQEISQTVFTMLARKASGLVRHPSLACWLHRAAVLEAAHQVRRESTHQRRLARLAAFSPDMSDPSPPGAPEPESGPPELDEALATLSESDRTLLMRRFFEDRSYAEIAELSGKNEPAVRKQLERALARLAPHLRRPAAASAGAPVLAGAAVLTATAKEALAASAVESLRAAMTHPAPAGFAAQAGSSALSAAPALTSLQVLIHTLRLMTYGNSLTITGAALALILAFGGSYSAARHFNSDGAAEGIAGFQAANGSDGNGPGGNGSTPGRAKSGQGQSGNPGDSPARAKVREQLAAISRTLSVDPQTRSVSIQFGANNEISGFTALGEFRLEDVEEGWKILPDFKGRPREFENLAFFLTGLRLLQEKPDEVLRELQEPGYLLEGKPPTVAMLAANAAWFKTDPAAAWAWRLKAVESGIFPTDRRRPIGVEEVGDWLGRDPQSALAALAPLGSEWDHFTREVLNEALKSDEKRGKVWPVLEKADDRTALMIADSHPAVSDWSRDTLLPWLLTRPWSDGTEAARVLNGWTWRDGELDEERFGMLCQAAGDLPTPAANEAALRAIRGVFDGVSPEAKPKLLEKLLKDPARREKLTAQL